MFNRIKKGLPAEARAHRDAKAGEIATILTVLTVGFMLFGIIAGTRLAQRQTNTSSFAGTRPNASIYCGGSCLPNSADTGCRGGTRCVTEIDGRRVNPTCWNSTTCGDLAQQRASSCNQPCSSSRNCGTSGFSCYQSHCRARNCLTDTTCECESSGGTTPPTVAPTSAFPTFTRIPTNIAFPSTAVTIVPGNPFITITPTPRFQVFIPSRTPTAFRLQPVSTNTPTPRFQVYVPTRTPTAILVGRTVPFIRPSATPTPTPIINPPTIVPTTPVDNICAPNDESLLNRLRCGGLVIYLRHASTDWSQSTRESEWITEVLAQPNNPALFQQCERQRLLSGQGRSLAHSIGQAFQNQNISVDHVITSQWCRTRDTAQLAFGKAEVTGDKVFDTGYLPADSSLRNRYRSSLQGLLAAVPSDGRNTVIVGHMPQLNDLLGIALEEGEATIIDPRTGHVIAERMRLSDWQNLTASSSNQGGVKSLDFDADGRVNALDYSRLISLFGLQQQNLAEDLNSDGVVNAIDYALMITRSTR